MVGRPFPKGKSGNPGGRPKGLAAKAREYADRALEVLSEALDDDDPKVRLAAAKEVLDRGYGKAVSMTADVSARLDDLDDDTLNSAIDALRAAIGSADEADGRKGPSTTH
jgi:hypothetical protein